MTPAPALDAWDWLALSCAFLAVLAALLLVLSSARSWGAWERPVTQRQRLARFVLEVLIVLASTAVLLWALAAIADLFRP